MPNKPKSNWKTLPSRRHRSRAQAIPSGCLPAWRVTTYDGVRWLQIGVYLNENLAYSIADTLWTQSKGVDLQVKVENKAVINIDGKHYLINIYPIKTLDLTKETYADAAAARLDTTGGVPAGQTESYVGEELSVLPDARPPTEEVPDYGDL